MARCGLKEADGFVTAEAAHPALIGYPQLDQSGHVSAEQFLVDGVLQRHPGALAAMREIYNAEDIDKAQVAIKAFEVDYGAKYPKSVAKIVDDADVLLEFYRYPAEHWIH